MVFAIKRVALALSFAATIIPTLAEASQWQWVKPQRLNALLKDGSGLWLVDVRSPAAFCAQHIEGAMNLPVELLAARKLPTQKMVVLVDDALGLRDARVAAAKLERNGHARVFILEEGLEAWNREGFPMVGSEARPIRGVLPQELAWARDNGVRLLLFDLRGRQERIEFPIAGARPVEGKDLAAQLKTVGRQLRKKEPANLADKLESSVTTILVFPRGVDARTEMLRARRDISGDVRYLDGGYAAWLVKPERKIMGAPASCPSCPGSAGGSEVR